MTPEQLQQVRNILAANRQPVDRTSHIDPRGKPYAHPRGWNDALDFVDRTLKEVLGEKP